MNTKVTTKAFRRAFYLTLGLSVSGLVIVCLLMLGPKVTFQCATGYAVQIAASYTAMILAAETSGIFRRSELRGYAAGVVFAIFLFITGVLCGSATSMFVYRDFDMSSYVVKPLFWMGLYGVLPAAAFGLIGTHLLRRISSATLPDADPLKRP
ncbi:hypothetical protein [Luteolibacter soli]|uniref:Uncharacterized protein n=1 Tax=Luteolibacter soli TaxID=3135280 RepID=A0ABU9AZ43_9BACT